MRKVVASVMLAGLVAPLLGGCSSWFARSQAAHSQPAVKAAPMSPHEAALMAGKDALRQGQYAAAITDFRIARLDPALEAESLNGLAIAYSNIGRPDLSERYFRQAVALAPDDRRFAANLARFQAISGKASSLAPVLAEAPPAPQPALAKASGIVAAAPSGAGSAVVMARAPETPAEPRIAVSGPAAASSAVAVAPARLPQVVASAPRVAAPAARAPLPQAPAAQAPAIHPQARTRPAAVAVAAPAIVVSRLSAHEVAMAPAPAARPRPAAAMAVRQPAPAARRATVSARLAMAERPAVAIALRRGERPGRLIGY